MGMGAGSQNSEKNFTGSRVNLFFHDLSSDHLLWECQLFFVVVCEFLLSNFKTISELNERPLPLHIALSVIFLNFDNGHEHGAWG